MDPFHLQNFHVELGVVGNDDDIYVVDQFLEFGLIVTSLDGWFILDYFVGDMASGLASR